MGSGLAELKNGNVVSAERVAEKMRQDYGV